MQPRHKAKHLTIIAPDTEVLKEIAGTISFRSDVTFKFVKLRFWQKLVLFAFRKTSAYLFTKYFLLFQRVQRNEHLILCFFDSPHLQHFDKNFLDNFAKSSHLYYWNPISNMARLQKEKTIFHSLSSFSSSDSKTHKILHIPQFYRHMEDDHCTETGDLYKLAVFFGRVKEGRDKRILNLIHHLDDEKVEYRIYLVGKFQCKDLLKFSSPELKYDAICKHIKSANYIIDLPHPSGGFSLRAIEAMYYGKDLILDRNYNLDDLNASQFLQFFNIQVAKNSELFLLKNIGRLSPIIYNNKFSINRFVDEVF